MKIRLRYWPKKYLNDDGDPLKILIIKTVKGITGLGLKESKGIVDTMFDHCYPLVTVTYEQYRNFVDDGWGVDIDSHDSFTQLVEHCFEIQKQLIVSGRIDSAKKMVDILDDLMHQKDERIPF